MRVLLLVLSAAWRLVEYVVPDDTHLHRRVPPW